MHAIPKSSILISLIFLFFSLKVHAVDQELLGTWQYNFINQATDTVILSADGIIKEKSILGGNLFMDSEATFELDITTSPKRMIQSVIKVHPDQVVKLNIGDRFYCIYQVVQKNLLNIDCSDVGVTTYPESFNEAFGYGKISDLE